MTNIAPPTAQRLALKRRQDQTLGFYFAVSPGSLAGKTFVFRLKSNRGESFVTILDETLDVSENDPDADETFATVELTADQTDLRQETYWWDVRTTDAADERLWAHGSLVIETTASH